MGRTSTALYSVYRGDELEAVGKAKEVCEQLGIKPCSLYSIVSRTRSGDAVGRTAYRFDLEDEDEDD